MANKNQKGNPLERGVKAGGETVDETVKEVGKLGGDAMTTAGKTIESGEHAATGVVSEGLHDVGKLGGEAGGMAKDAAENIAATPHDVAKAAWTGKPESKK